MSDSRSDLLRLLEEEPPALDPIKGDELVVYGAGGAGRSVAAAAKKRGWIVRAFLDARAKSLGEIDGIPCHAPESGEARALAREALPVVVAVFNFAADLRPIFRMLKGIGFPRIVSFYEAHELFGMEPQFWLGKRDLYRSARAEIMAAFDLFEDETSRRIFRDQIALRLTFDTSLLNEPDQANHYTPADLPPLSQPLRMVDGGAFNGDTLQLLMQKALPVDGLAAFEPDPENFAQLRARVNDLNGKMRDVILLPCGLSNVTAVRRFASGSGAASALQSEGDTAIQVVALDDVLPTFGPNFIKLDIEGAEPEALLGAARSIERFAPRLAVCVYHTPEHLWTLPRLIHELRSDYRLALRYHQFNGFDVVAYAIPQ